MRIPMYKQIRQLILDKIQRGEWQAHEQLPSENEWVSQFQVSRITIRNALSRLVEEGLIYRIQGKGSFVASPGEGEQPVVPMHPTSHNNPSPPLIAYIMPWLYNRFTMNLLSGVEDEIASAGGGLLFFKTGDSQEEERRAIRTALQLGVKGIIIFPADGEHYNEDLVRLTWSRFPIVLIDREMKGIAAHAVSSDHEGGAYQAVQHLIDLGHRRIGFVGTGRAGTTSIIERLAGYERALSERGIPIEHRYRLLYAEPDSIAEYIKNNQELTAVFADNSGSGHLLMHAAERIGIEIPRQLSIIFFDNYEFTAFSPIAPTIMLQQEAEIGREAARQVLRLIDNPDHKPQRTILPVQLVVRESTAPPSPES